MKISLVGTRGYPSSYGGFETLVRHLAPYLQGAGHDVTVFDRSPGPWRGRVTEIDGIRVMRSFGARGSSTSTLTHGLTSMLMTAVDRPDVALIMNVANGFFLPALRARHIPTVLNVDGIEWERAKWSRLGRKVFRAGAVATARWADHLVSDSRAIAERWRREFGRDSTFIPYGGDPTGARIDPALVTVLGLEPLGYVLVVARFVPENNVELMLEAGRRTGRPVVVVGSNPGSALDARLRAQHAPPAVHMLGHVSDQDLLASLWAHCGVYLHGHSVGGTNPALVQAMGMGAATVALDTVFNREVLVRDGMLAPPDVEEIARRASLLLDSPAQHTEAAEWGRGRVADVYNWAVVCKAYEDIALHAAGRSWAS
jgi:glycosyltransferase involved in cell wall biosynthesis